MSTTTWPSAGRAVTRATSRAARGAWVRASTEAGRARTKARSFGQQAGLPGGMALCTLIFGTVAGQAVTDALGSMTAKFAALGLSGLGAVVCYARWDRSYQAASVADAYGKSGTARLPQRRGLVLLLGLDSGDPQAAATQLLASLPNLEYLAMVGTPETTARSVSATLVEKVLPRVGPALPAAHVRLWDFGNAASVSDAEEATSEALRWLMAKGLAPEEIVVDISSGRRPMTYGAKDAADDVEVETQYLAEEWDTKTNAPIAGTKHFKVVKTYTIPE